MTTTGPCTTFPAPGLRMPNRYISGHNNEGEAIFLQTDHGDHRAPMLDGIAAQNIMYSSASNPVELTDNADLEFIKTRPPLHYENGCIVRMIDFAPGAGSELHRSLCLVVGTCCEGEMEFGLSSGEKRIMRPGDVSVNRAAMHKWRNVSKDKPARMLYFMLDVKPVIINGKALDFDMGPLADEYAKYNEGEGYYKSEAP